MFFKKKVCILALSGLMSTSVLMPTYVFAQTEDDIKVKDTSLLESDLNDKSTIEEDSKVANDLQNNNLQEDKDKDKKSEEVIVDDNREAFTGFLEENGVTRYYNQGEFVKGAYLINDELYYFDGNTGKMTTAKGWFYGSDNKKRYGLGEGKVANDGPRKIENDFYYFISYCGLRKPKDWIVDNDGKCWSYPDGRLATGNTIISGKIYYFSKTTAYFEKMATGFVTVGKDKYYCDSKGNIKKGHS